MIARPVSMVIVRFIFFFSFYRTDLVISVGISHDHCCDIRYKYQMDRISILRQRSESIFYHMMEVKM